MLLSCWRESTAIAIVDVVTVDEVQVDKDECYSDTPDFVNIQGSKPQWFEGWKTWGKTITVGGICDAFEPESDT
jgi:hypothetical protein